MTGTEFGSLTRISNLATAGFDAGALEPYQWAVGDYVVGRVTGEPTRLYQVESPTGDMRPVTAGMLVVGAFGDRAATLEAVGSFRAISNGRMNSMTSAGLFGHLTSVSPLLPPTMTLDYVGHALRKGVKVTMQDFALQAKATRFSTPTVLLVGTSMSAGKTETGKRVCRLVSEAGRRVIGAKLTGAGRFRDILAFRHAGAECVFDFVDAGLPSTIVTELDFRSAIQPLLAHIDGLGADLLVAEAGASPLEPYNGAAAIDELGENICLTILCASDPYAVVGVCQAFGLAPDLVTGPATSTSAAIDLVRELTGIRCINIIDPNTENEFRQFLSDRLGLMSSG